ncbi:MAG: hypothetical protein HYS26_00180 [Candidatus Kaiserbacteria bacterium]|nr:MAG: hypothetical protein HYS26_00180 [Candidatus Kaiserbacteria bacterium]
MVSKLLFDRSPHFNPVVSRKALKYVVDRPPPSRFALMGERTHDKTELLRLARGKYPIYCQVVELGRRYQWDNPYNGWRRRFETEHDLAWALGGIEGSFLGIIRPVFVVAARFV